MTAGVARRVAAAAVFAALAASGLCAERYAGAEAAAAVPQGGARTDRACGGAVRLGAYLSDFWAVECGVAQLEKSTLFGAGLLGHWSAWGLYDRFFGYSPFDPFLTLGARCRVGGGAGPKAGLGAFWHLGERWSARASADASLEIDARPEAVWTFSVGVQRAF